MKDNRKTIQVLLIFTVIFSIMGGSLAYWNWNTTEGERTNVVFTVTSDFSCAADGGGNITNNDVMLAPTTCTDTSRAIKRKVTVTPTLNRETMTLSMDLWLTINDLGEGLKKSNNFRYVLTTSSNSCEEGTIMASGNFKGRKEGNKVNLLINELYVDTSIVPEEYWLYIWLDEEETSPSTMNQTFSLSLGGQCEEVETLVGDAYALLVENGNVVGDSCMGEEGPGYDLVFVRSETPITAGSEYDGKVVTEVYSDIETTTTAPWSSHSDYITNVEFKDTIRPIDTSDWFRHGLCFSGYNDELNVSKLDTSQVTDMSGMFQDDGDGFYSYVKLIGLENFDTSKVTNMSNMFWSTSHDINGVISSWDTSNVTSMSYMFEGSYNMDDFDIANWDVSKVTNMSGMFAGGYAGGGDINLDLSNWNVSSVVDMSWMLGNYRTITNLGDISSWDVSNVTDMSYMFDWARINADIDLSGWDVSNVGNYLNFDNIYDDESTGTLISPVWKNAYFKIYSETDNSLRIYNDINVPSIGDVYDGRIVTKVHNMSATASYDSSSFSCSTTIVPTSIVVVDNVKPYSLDSLFSGCTKVNYVDVTKLDVSNVSNMSYMFRNVGSDSSVTSFTILGLDKWNTSNVTSMSNIFYNMGLNADYTLDLSGWDVSKVSSWGHSNFDYGVTDKIIDPLWE